MRTNNCSRGDAVDGIVHLRSSYGGQPALRANDQRSVSDSDRGDRRRHHGQVRRVRVDSRRRRRGGAHDAAGRRARHAPPVRQRHARPALQRQLRRQDRDAVSRYQRAGVGRRAFSRRATSAASRASRSIRSSTSAARAGSASSTPYTDTTQHDAGGRLQARRRQPHARHGPARMDGEESRRRDLRWRTRRAN